MADKPIRILVVDDNPAGRYSTAHVLRSVGWTVLEAATGNDALTLVEQAIDLVVLDVNLPDIDGFEVCRRIRDKEQLARIPVIHLSATFVKDVDKVHGLEAGADGYLVHPVEPPVLIATVKAFLRARNAELDREQLLVSERAARAEAERANRIKDDFLATLSHELRTPLQAIIGWAQLLQLGKLSPSEMAEGVNTIERNARAQAQMIADLLDVSRITSGKLRLDVKSFDPAVIIEAVLSAIQPAADAKGVQLEKTIDSKAGSISGDPSRLQQVVWNLVNNAVKFTPKGGRIHVELQRNEAHLQISVTDTGQGIDASLLPRVFERFHQGDASASREHGGLGLGLAIAKQLVELHGGTIAAQSAGAGQGAKFTVTLPPFSQGLSSSRPSGSTASDEGALHQRKRLDGVRVLLVDDDNDARNMLVRILNECGAVTKGYEGVTQALAALESFHPQVLVSDIGMPGHDGFELIQKIRELGYSFQELPAIALTGFARPEDRRRALLAGFQIHVAKPVDPHELTVAIATLAGRSD